MPAKTAASSNAGAGLANHARADECCPTRSESVFLEEFEGESMNPAKVG